jgi:hypothetical protein
MFDVDKGTNMQIEREETAFLIALQNPRVTDRNCSEKGKE